MNGLAPICPYCGNFSKLVTGAAIYPHRQDLAALNFYQCAPCDAYVGCHKAGGSSGDGTRPLGRLANAELRSAKKAAHAVFDPIWLARLALSPALGRTKARNRCYAELAKAMGIPREQCHIGMMDVADCRRVVAICGSGQLSEVSA